MQAGACRRKYRGRDHAQKVHRWRWRLAWWSAGRRLRAKWKSATSRDRLGQPVRPERRASAVRLVPRASRVNPVRPAQTIVVDKPVTQVVEKTIVAAPNTKVVMWTGFWRGGNMSDPPAPAGPI